MGGGIYMTNTRNDIWLNNKSIVSGNTTAGNGGGIAVEGTFNKVNLNHSAVFEDNEAIGNGGGIYCNTEPGDGNILYFLNATFVNNVAGQDGGGIYVTNHYGNLQLPLTCTGYFSGNRALHLIDPSASSDVPPAGIEGTISSISPSAFTSGESNEKLVFNNYDINFIGSGEVVWLNVTYHYNDGETENEVISIAPNTTASIPDVEREEWHLDGWYETEDFTSGLYDFETSVTSDIDLFAKWTINQYTLTYDGNGNTSGTVPSAQAYDYGTNVPVATVGSLTKTGYTFLGWSTSETATAEAYKAGDNLLINEAVTLYAVWKKDAAPIVDDEDDEIVIGDRPIDEEDPEVLTDGTITYNTSVNNSITNFETDNTYISGADTQPEKNNDTFIDEKPVPEDDSAPTGAWSLLSLILSIAAVISVLLAVVTALRRRENKNGILQIIAIAVGILTPIVWLLLDNLSQPMVFINKWTILVAIIFAVHLILTIAYKKKGRSK
jgi:uncharacterized repeat protein (TIGR02543 family)